MYTVMVQAYLEEVDEKMNLLRKSVEEEDFDTYRINAHSLKSTSLQVGAVRLSEFAKKLELAAKGEDYQQIRQENEALLALYESVRQTLQADPTL